MSARRYRATGRKKTTHRFRCMVEIINVVDIGSHVNIITLMFFICQHFFEKLIFRQIKLWHFQMHNKLLL